ncbi:MAG: hypothetical protein ABIH23_30535 [bacterium]
MKKARIFVAAFIFTGVGLVLGASAQVTAVRTLPEHGYLPGVQVDLSIEIAGEPGTVTVVETPPEGWTISGLRRGGRVENGVITWSVTFARPVTLSYSVTPPATATGDAVFSGKAGDIEIGGMTTLVQVEVDVPLCPGTVMRFASVEEGREILGTVDDYIRNVSLFQRQAIVGSTEDVTEEEFLQFLAEQALAWDVESIRHAKVNIKRAAEMLEPLDLHLPDVIYLIRTTGLDHDYSWYTRQDAIMIPEDYAWEGYLDEYILVHETFHIFSRHNSAVRDELYSILGYHPCGAPIEYPDSLVKLANPDAPVIAHTINVEYQGNPLSVAPIYYSSSETYTGDNLYSYWKYGFIAVEESSEGWVYQRVDGEPLIMEESALEGYWDQVGENTDYDIHPEERLAESLRILCAGRPGHYGDLPTPRIIEAMDAVLAGPRQYPEMITEPLREFIVDDRATSIGFSEDGTKILTCSAPYSRRDATIITWDAASGLQLDTLSVDHPYSGEACRSEFSPDGTLISLVNGDYITMWDVKNKQQLYSFLQLGLEGWAFSPDGTQFVTCWSRRVDYTYYYVTFWDTVTGLELNTFPIEFASAPVYSPDASQIMIWRTLYDAETGDAIQIVVPTNVISDNALSPDGAQILTAEFDFWTQTEAVRLWDTATGEELRSFAFGIGFGASSVKFSPDGRWILIGDGNTASLWDAAGEKEIRVFQHPEIIRFATFSPNGNYILTACDDGIVRLWDISDLAATSNVGDFVLYR